MVTERPLRIHSRQMFDALIAADIIRNGDYVRRVIIDVEIGKAVIMHVERFGDERLLGLIGHLEGAEIRTGIPDVQAEDREGE